MLNYYDGKKKKRLHLRDPFPWACWRPTPRAAGVRRAASHALGLCSRAQSRSACTRLPAGSRASGGTGIERQLPGTRPAQSVQGTCPPAWGQREQEGPCNGSFLKPQSFPEMPRDSCQVSRPETEQGCTFLFLLSVQKISDVPDTEDLHFNRAACFGDVDSNFPVCLLPGRLYQTSNYYISQSQGKREEKAKHAKQAWVKEKIGTWAGSNADISFWRSSYFYFYFWNPTNILKEGIHDSWCSFTFILAKKTKKIL